MATVSAKVFEHHKKLMERSMLKLLFITKMKGSLLTRLTLSVKDKPLQKI